MNIIPFKLRFVNDLKTKSKYLVKPNKLKNDPLQEIISDYKEVEKYRELNETNFFKESFLNISNIQKILYIEDKIIYVEFKNQTLTELYYLTKLICKNISSIDFSFTFDFIKKIHNININENKAFRKIILSKIILELIDNYKNLDIKDIIDEEEIENIVNKNRLYISENINYLSQIGLNYNEKEIENIDIEDLYVEIVYSLIKSENKKYRELSKIFNQMDLGSIDISKKIYEKYLEKLFNNSNDNKLEQYAIKEDRFINLKRINFYYILFNYILKDSYYIYQNQFLLQARKTIINAIIKKKTKLNIASDISSKKSINKIKSIIIKFLDCNYYIKIAKEYFKQNFEPKNIEKKNTKYSHYVNNRQIIYDNFYPEYVKNSMLSQRTNLNSTKISNQKISRVNIVEKKNEENSEQPEYLYSNPTISFFPNKGNKKEEQNKNNNSKINCIKEINDVKLNHEENNDIQKIEYKLRDICVKLKIFDESKKGVQINDDIIVYTNNSFFNGEQDQLVFYNKISDIEFKIIYGYSFSLGLNGCAVMNKEIVICPCKQYKEGQKNGFFLASYKNDRILFKETSNFKVHCICPLLNEEHKETNYFLVSGFEGKAKLKLYKLINGKNNGLDIEFLDEIFIQENGYLIDFKKPINSIKQAKISGHLFFYWDKKIYIFSQPYLSKYSFMEENRKLDYLPEAFDIQRESDNHDFYDKIYDEE